MNDQYHTHASTMRHRSGVSSCWVYALLLSFLLLLRVGQAQDCRTVCETEVGAIAQDTILHATRILSLNGEVTSPGQAIFRAGNSVFLREGFRISSANSYLLSQSGIYFTASYNQSDTYIDLEWAIDTWYLDLPENGELYVSLLDEATSEELYFQEMDIHHVQENGELSGSYRYEPGDDQHTTFELRILLQGPGTPVTPELTASGGTATFRAPDITVSQGTWPDRILINVTNHSDLISEYRLTRSGDHIALLDGTGAEHSDSYSFSDPGSMENGVEYEYCIIPYSNQFNETFDPVCFNGLSLPINLQATDQAFDSRVELTWNDMTAYTDAIEITRDGETLVELPNWADHFTDEMPVYGNVHEYGVVLLKDDSRLVAAYDQGGVSPNGSITGRVTTQDGSYATEGVQVVAMTEINNETYRDTVYTDQTGSYAFDGLLYGEEASYQVLVGHHSRTFLDNPRTLSFDRANHVFSGIDFQDEYTYSVKEPTFTFSDLSVVANETQDLVQLDWHYASVDPAIPVYFQVFRKVTGESDSLLIDLLTNEGHSQNQYRDYSGIPHTAYTYSVQAYIIQNDSVSQVVKSGSTSYPQVAVFEEYLMVQPNTDMGTIDLHWLHTSHNLTGFHLYRDDELIATIDHTDHYAFQDMKGKPGTNHTYSVSAFVEREGQSYESTQTASDPVSYPTLPEVIGLSTSATQEEVTFTWTYPAVVPDYNYDGVYIYREGKHVGTVLKDFPAIFSDRSGAPGVSYTYTFHTFKYNEEQPDESTGIGQQGGRQSLPAPQNLVASGNQKGYVELEWDYPVENYDGFLILRGTEADTVARLPNGSQTFKDAVPGSEGASTHTYFVKAYQQTEEAVHYSSVAQTTGSVLSNGGVEALQAPDNFTASEGLSGHVLLDWEYPEPIHSEFNVYRDGDLLATLSKDDRVYYDHTAQLNASHMYQLEASYEGQRSWMVGDLGSLGSVHSISGTVINEQSGMGVPGIVIEARATIDGSTFIRSVATDSAGHYQITNAPNRPGIEVTVRASGQNRILSESEQSFVIDADQIAYTVNFTDLYDSPLPVSDEVALPVDVVAVPDPVAQQVSIRWNVNASNYSGFKVYRGLVELADISSQHHRMVIDSGGYPGHVYSYRVQAYWHTATGTKFSEFGVGSAIYPMIPDPEYLRLVQLEEEDRIRLSWSHLADKHDYYEINRGEEVLGIVATGEELTFYDTTGIPGRNYRYSVTAVKNTSEGLFTSGSISGYLGYPQVSKVEHLNHSFPDDQNYITLSWSHESSHHDGYLIERDGILIDTLNYGTRTVNDPEGIPGAEYEYRVISYVDKGGVWYESVPIKTTLSYPAIHPVSGLQAVPDPALGQLELWWTYVPEDVTGYHVYRDHELTATISDPSVTSWTDTEGTPGISHTYEVVAFVLRDGQEYSGVQSVVGDYPMVPAPLAVVASDEASVNFIEISWEHAPQNHSGFYLYEGNATTRIATLTAGKRRFKQVYDESGMVNRTYRLRAFREVNGEEYLSDFSNEAMGTTGANGSSGNLNNVTASKGAYTNRVSVTWESTNPGNVKIYKDEQHIATEPALNGIYQDVDATPGQEYVYRVELIAEGYSLADKGYRKPNGSIAGSVLTQQGAVGVPEVSVTATALIDGERYTYSTHTDVAGEFEFSDVYYQEATDYSVSVHYPGHTFVKDTQEASLDLQVTNAPLAPFFDQTAYVLSGFVSRGGVCAIDSVEVTLTTIRNGELLTEDTETNDQGYYSFTLNPQDQQVSGYRLLAASEKTYEGENGELETTSFDFTQPEVTFTRAQIDALPLETVVDFEEEQTYPVTLNVQTTCGPIGSSRFEVRVTSADGCYAHTYQTLDNGRITVNLLPLDYELVVTGASGADPQTLAVVDYLRVRPVHLNLFDDVHRPIEKGETTLAALKDKGRLDMNFTFHKAPKLSVTGIENYFCGDPTEPAVIRQGELYSLNLSVAETHEDGDCPVNEGFLVIKNPAAASAASDTLRYTPDLNGFESYGFVGGDPITVAPYTLGMVVEYHTEHGGYQGETIQRFIVEGDRSQEGNDFVITLDDDQQVYRLPLFVLRDPPGDQSYSYIENGTTFSKNLTVSDMNSGGAGLKTEQEANFFGMGGFAEYAINFVGGNGESASFDVSVTTTERIETSAESALGHNYVLQEQADVIVGVGVSTAYGVTENIQVVTNEDNQCEVQLNTRIQLVPNGLKTDWYLTVFEIERLIEEYSRQLDAIADGTLVIEGLEGESSAEYVSALKANWEGVLDYHRRESVPMCQVCNLDGLPEVFQDAVEELDVYTSFCNNLGGIGACELDDFEWTNELMEQYETLNQFTVDLKDHIENTYGPNQLIESLNDALFITEGILDLVDLDGEYQQLFGPEVEIKPFYGSTGTIDESVTVGRSGSRGITQRTYVNSETYVGLNFNIAIAIAKGLGVTISTAKEVESNNKVGITAEYHFEYERSQENTLDATATVGYVLADDDDGDQYSVTIVKGIDPSHTPYFSLQGGRSSCPAEPGTISRFDPQLFIQLPDGSLTKEATLYDVDPDGPASFRLQMSSGNLFNENLQYYLYVPTEYTDFVPNQNDAEIVLQVGGENDGTGTRYILPGVPEYTQVDINRREGDIYDYEDIVLAMSPKCEENYNIIADYVFLKVHFKRPCSPVSLLVDGNRDPFGNGTTDGENWVINKAPENEREQLFLKLVDYDPENVPLEDITIQYRRLGSNNWHDIETIDKEFLAEYYEEFSATYPEPTYPYVWDITDSELVDGEYEIRALSACGTSGENYSNVLTGVIDRTSLHLFGNPEPADGILTLGDEVSISFNDRIDCGLFEAAEVSLINTTDGSPVPFSVGCLGNQLAFTLDNVLLSALEGVELEATVNHVPDHAGNGLDAPISWRFEVHHNPVYWYPDQLQLQVLQGATATLTGELYNTSEAAREYTLEALPKWLTVGALHGSIPPSGAAIDFTIDASVMDIGTYDVNVVAAIDGFASENLTLQVEVLPEMPGWFPDYELYPENMAMVMNFDLDGTGLSTDTLDLISVWIGNSLRGVTNIRKVAENTFAAYLTISGTPEDNGQELSYRIWDASTGIEYQGYPMQAYTYEKDQSYGTSVQPVLLYANSARDRARYIPLKAGWNWISFNTEQEDMSVTQILSGMGANEGDQIKNQTQTSMYALQNGWESLDGLDTLNTEEGYQLYLTDADTLRLTGIDALMTNITLQEGWNWIGYQPQEAQSPDAALANLESVTGDQIKSENGLAEYSEDANGWLGMELLEPNHGYQLYVSEPKSLRYRSHETARVSYSATSQLSMEKSEGSWYLDPADYELNLDLTGKVILDEELDTEQVVVGAFVGDECRGIATPVYHAASDQYLVSLFVYANREDELVKFRALDQITGQQAEIGNKLTFKSNMHKGSITAPYLFGYDSFEGEGNLLIKPNPIEDHATIAYSVSAKSSQVSISLFDVNGYLVKNLMEQRSHTEGRYELVLNAQDMPSAGWYVCRVQIGDNSYTEKVMLLK
ncbi:MAG: T9SS type A sorting domain-containing protein [Bacteroidota bacterium]